MVEQGGWNTAEISESEDISDYSDKADYSNSGYSQFPLSSES